MDSEATVQTQTPDLAQPSISTTDHAGRYDPESDHEVTEQMVSLVPQLHTFARSLCRDAVRADDLVQEALLRAFNNIRRFKPGTNLKAWLFTIVRNEHYSQLRRRKFEAHDIAPELLPEPSVPPDHDGELELRDLNRALATLSAGQRAALILVSASGFSYEEAAAICGCAVGTIKSRVARARSSLIEMLEGRAPLARESERPSRPMSETAYSALMQVAGAGL